MDEFFPFLGLWAWWVAAGVLLVLELLSPGIFFIWLGIAAGLTGLIDSIVDLPWQAELLIFAVLSVVTVLAGRRFYRGPGTEPEDNPYLNRRQLGYVGRTFTLKQPIVDGRGKLSIEDTLWQIEGPDMPAGAHVRVTAASGMTLKVEAV